MSTDPPQMVYNHFEPHLLTDLLASERWDISLLFAVNSSRGWGVDPFEIELSSYTKRSAARYPSVRSGKVHVCTACFSH